MKKIKILFLMMCILIFILCLAFCYIVGVINPIQTSITSTTPLNKPIGKDNFTENGLELKLNETGTEYSIVGRGDCTDSEIVIPAEHNGLPITTIAAGSFMPRNVGIHDYHYTDTVKTVVVSEGIKTIEMMAFLGCNALETVTLPSTLTSIGMNAFNNCPKLKSIDIPASLNRIETGAFGYCESLAEVNISNGVTEIGAYAFAGCISLTQIDIPNSVTSIEEGAFSQCIALININLSNAITSIDEKTFEECISLIDINIPNSVNIIGEYAFHKCSALKDVTLSEDLTEIGERAFKLCYALEAINFPASLRKIGNTAFYYCSSLKNIYLNEGLETIEDSAFIHCLELESIYIPQSLENVDRLFEYCDSLVNITTDMDGDRYSSIDGNLYSKDGTVLIQYAIGKKSDTFEIPQHVTKIDQYAFYGSKYLVNVQMPEGLLEIGHAAFWECRSLVFVTIPSTVTSIVNSAFVNCTSLVELCNKSSIILEVGVNIPSYIEHICSDESQSYLVNVNDYIFYDDGSKVYLIRYIGDETELVLPKYENDRQYEIFKCAFYRGNNNSITSVVISDSVIGIQDEAFWDASSIEKIVIFKSVKNIGWHSFFFCNNATIYCEADEKPDTWNKFWNCVDYLDNTVPVVWDYNP